MSHITSPDTYQPNYSPMPSEDYNGIGYIPEPTYDPPVYQPDQAPEHETDHERRAIDFLNRVVDRDNERASERYGRSLFGKIRGWMNREGHRNEAQTLEQVAEWNNNSKFKKWIRIGSKIAGGIGVATAMVMTGGAGAIVTPLLWTAGVKEAYDGALEVVEELGWGRGRAKTERNIQRTLSQEIHKLKERLQNGEPMTEDEFQNHLNQIIDNERQVIETQQTNMTKEKKWKLGRSIASSVLTFGTGLFAGVPLGVRDYDNGPTQVADMQLDNTHRTFWNIHGGQFAYNNPAEVNGVIEQVARFIKNPGVLPWSWHGEYYGQISHLLGGSISFLDKIGLAASGAYLLGRIGEQLIGRNRRLNGYCDEQDYFPDYTPYSDYWSYNSPESPGGEPSQPSYMPEQPRTAEKDRKEIDSYFARMPEEYRKELKEINQNMEPMDPNCKASICIPVAYSEHGGIYKSLESYTNQEDPQGNKLDPRLFEIILFVNGPEDKAQDIKKTKEQINRFKAEHPNLKIQVFDKTFPGRTTIGRIRKYPNDLSLLRSNLRDRAENPLLLISNDADNHFIDNEYLFRAFEAFENDAFLEIATGKVDYEEADYIRYPYLRAARRLWQYVDIVMRYRGENLPKTLGNNSVMRAQSYARVGGYPDVSVAEDLRIGGNIAKTAGKEAVRYINQLKILSDPRRDLDAIANGKPVVRMYDNFGMNDKLREKVDASHLEQLSPNDPRFKKMLALDIVALTEEQSRFFFFKKFDRNKEVIALKQSKKSNPDELKKLEIKLLRGQMGKDAFYKACQVINRSLGFLGVKADIGRDKTGNIIVNITNMDRLRQKLAQREVTTKK